MTPDENELMNLAVTLKAEALRRAGKTVHQVMASQISAHFGIPIVCSLCGDVGRLAPRQRAPRPDETVICPRCMLSLPTPTPGEDG